MSAKDVFPHVIIAGVGRSGTTSLFRYLQQHPGVCASSKKEVAALFWQPALSGADLAQAYTEYFGSCTSGEQVRVEASPQYVLNPVKSAELIRENFPDVKLIFMLRNPITRAISAFRLFRKYEMLPQDISFDQYVARSLSFNYKVNDPVSLVNNEHIWSEIYRGQYALLLKPYFNLFPVNNIFVGFLENLEENPGKLMQEIATYIDIDPDYYNSFEYEIENRSISVKWPWLYRVALEINIKFEPLFNKYPVIRNNLRQVHNNINQDVDDVFPVPESSIKALLKMYLQSNEDLKALLKMHYPNINLPEWL